MDKGNAKQLSGKKLKADVDYYIENGTLVFTIAYHLKRGYCCQSGCRHCPYEFKKENIDKLERR
ncbi:MAG: hypothetical protein KF687_16105 [Cyclobacteriaceae bacterium]|nr:hypothetical protein [Cyclobacteriaceae bacterium]